MSISTGMCRLERSNFLDIGIKKPETRHACHDHECTRQSKKDRTGWKVGQGTGRAGWIGRQKNQRGNASVGEAGSRTQYLSQDM